MAKVNTVKKTNGMLEKKIVFNALTKYKAENEVWRGIEEGLSAVITNPGIIIGPSYWGGQAPPFLNKYIRGFLIFQTEKWICRCPRCSKCHHSINGLQNKWGKIYFSGENLSYKSVFDDIALSLNKPKPNKKATRSLLEIAWRLEAIRCFITNKKQSITKETARTSNQINIYENQKIIKALNYQFRTIKEAISNTSNFLLKSK